jgi:1,4-dihydroxy-2-naphthoate octaprenyltransferase
VPIVFLLMGPLMVEGGYYAISGTWSLEALVLSVPVGLLVAAILHGNEWRDISEDTRAGIVTLSSRLGRDVAHYGYIGLVVGAYIALGLAVVLAGCRPRSCSRSSACPGSCASCARPSWARAGRPGPSP